MLARFRIVAAIAALLFVVGGLGGCPSAEGLPWNAAPSADSSADGAGEDGTAERPVTLQEMAADIASGNDGGELAWSYGSTTISVNPNIDVGDEYVRTYGPPYTGSWSVDDDQGGSGLDGWYGSGGFGGSGGGDDSDDDDGPGDGPGDSGDDPPCNPDSSWTGWNGDVYYGNVQVVETESLHGYGESGYEETVCITLGFDQDGGLYVPIPLFANDDLLTVSVHSQGQIDVYDAWLYEVTVTVLSVTHTPDSTDAVLDIDVSFVGANSAITAQGVHTLHLEAAGGSLVYVALTHYDGYFRAGDESAPDWEGFATQDYDCTGLLTRR